MNNAWHHRVSPGFVGTHGIRLSMAKDEYCAGSQHVEEPFRKQRKRKKLLKGSRK